VEDKDEKWKQSKRNVDKVKTYSPDFQTTSFFVSTTGASTPWSWGFFFAHLVRGWLRGQMRDELKK
jgi:hypothetical protein